MQLSVVCSNAKLVVGYLVVVAVSALRVAVVVVVMMVVVAVVVVVAASVLAERDLSVTGGGCSSTWDETSR
jgi:hypothetical protein